MTQALTRARSAPAARRVRSAQRAGEGRAALVMLAPWIIGIAVLTIGPMLTSLYYSFTDYDLLTDPQLVGTANYRRLLDDPRYLKSLQVTGIYVLTSVPLKLIVALAVALVLHKSIRGVGLYRAALYVPSLLGSSVAVAILWRIIFGADGVFNQVLGVFGVEGRSWVSSPDTALWTLVVLAVWQFGSPMVIFLAALSQVPKEYYEAASLDGATRWTQFRRITLPMITPIVFFNLVLQTVNAFQTFTPSYVVSGGTGGPSDSTLLYSLYLYLEAFTRLRMGYASAMAWVLFLIVAVATAILFATSKRWVHYSND